jgi:DNA-binding beta-propeller fold protein YncE
MTKLKKILVSILFTLILVLSAADAVNAVGVNATIKVGLFPLGVAYDSEKGEIFVANWLSNSIDYIR